MNCKIISVEAMPGLVLKAIFESGETRFYDVAPLKAKFPAFETLSTTPGLFESARVDACGYGVMWNDEIDLASEEIWFNGLPRRLRLPPRSGAG
jgi:hypothetical protein